MTNKAKELAAFPFSYRDGKGDLMVHFGLSVREYYAASFLNGILSTVGDAPYLPAEDAACAVRYADALMAELAKQPETPKD